MGVRRIIRPFHFDSRRVARLTFSDTSKIRLNDDDKTDPFISLKKQDSGGFPKGLDITATTETISPQALIKWIGFEGLQTEPKNTSVRYRLVVDGGHRELFWFRSRWREAVKDFHWSTFQEINDRIGSLPIQQKDIAIKMQLRSSDGLTTPEVRSVKLLGEFDVDWVDDLIFSVLSRLHKGFRSKTYIGLILETNTSLIDFSNTHKLDNQGYNFTNVIRAFNLTADPHRTTNIARSYSQGPLSIDGQPGPGQLTLSRKANKGDHLEVVMEIVPEFARSTSQDFLEESRLPVLMLERPVEVKGRDRARQERSLGHPGEIIRNFTSGTAVRTPPPKQVTMRFEFRILANSDRDLSNLIDAMSLWVTENKILRTEGLDTEVVLDPGDEINILKKVDLDDVREATGNFQVQGVPFFLEPSQDYHLVEMAAWTLRNWCPSRS